MFQIHETALAICFLITGLCVTDVDTHVWFCFVRDLRSIIFAAWRQCPSADVFLNFSLLSALLKHQYTLLFIKKAEVNKKLRSGRVDW